MSADTVPGDQAPSDAGRGRDRVAPPALVGSARAVMARHWRERGYTVPNAQVYPHQWLWDSCFHSVIWAHLGEPARALAELRSLFACQHDDGFVPHMTYWEHPDLHASFWGGPAASTITQPPMYGHALAELIRLGVRVDAELIDRAVAGLDFLVGPRRGDRALVPILHPWESGCDDSPRWDRWAGEGRTTETWYRRKGELVASLVRSPEGSSLANPAFEVEAAGFNALVLFNAAELVSVGAPAPSPALGPMRDALDRRWDDAAGTWRDADDPPTPVRTLEALLPVLVTDREDVVDAVFGQILDDRAFGGACGPAQVHRDEPSFDPASYWRGPAWPQLTYLLWVAAHRRGRADDAERLAAALVRGAERSGLAEYWEPDSGAGRGAVPQSWAALAAVVTRTARAGRRPEPER